MSQPTAEAWRIVIDQQIEKEQPFHLLYVNSQNQNLEFTVRYAKVCFYEKRFYLQIWCDETADVERNMLELPDLWYNRCLRLDRIQAVFPINGTWRGQLDSIEVHLQFRNWLANAYEPKADDLEDRRVGDVRHVVRRVVNPFGLLREVARYWDDCVILAPEGLRLQMQQEIVSIARLYNLDDISL